MNIPDGESESTICAMCLKSKPLRFSHLMPAFVFGWLKRGSATGLLKRAEDDRVHQDGEKKPLLCDDCEGVLNRAETPFSKHLFYPYVDEELSDVGVCQGKFTHFEYGEWLLRFIISIQWRQLATTGMDFKGDPPPQRFLDYLLQTKEIWRQFLLGERIDSGESKSYVFFLQNMAAGAGQLPDYIPDFINRFIFLTVDGTVVFGKGYLGIYSKIGPIVLWTSMRPSELPHLGACRIRRQGRLGLRQDLVNHDVNRFLFSTRPRTLWQHVESSLKVQEAGIKRALKNPDRAANSRSFMAFNSDAMLAESRGRDFWGNKKGPPS